MEQKLERLQQKLVEQNVDCLALIPGANMQYITGVDFHLMERPIIGLFFQADNPLFVTPNFELERLSKSAVDAKTYSDGGQSAGDVLGDALSELASLPQTVAVEYLTMRVLEQQILKAQLPNMTMLDADPIMSALRERKSAPEIQAMRDAIEITENALEDVLSELEPGITEKQLAERLGSALREHGGEAPPFSPIVLTNERAALPHNEPSDYEIRTGDVLLIDFGTSKHGYISDITRMFYVGQPPNDEVAELHNVLLQANEAGRAAISPGVTCESIDRATRQVVVEAGLGEYFIHRTGHGIGMQAHEEPYIVEGNKKVLEAGMTFTVEPGLYLPGKVGLRIEDDVLVTEDGAETLTTFDRSIRVVEAI